MFSFPNSLFKLCDKARRPNLPAAKALVVVLPLKDAVAPVNIKLPRLPSSLSSLPLNAVMARRENVKAARIFVSSASATSSSVICKNGFQTPCPAFHTATRRVESGQYWVMDLKAEVKEAVSYNANPNGAAWYATGSERPRRHGIPDNLPRRPQPESSKLLLSNDRRSSLSRQHDIRHSQKAFCKCVRLPLEGLEILSARCGGSSS